MTAISSLSSATAASPVDAASKTAAKAKAEAAPAFNLSDVVSISDEAREKFRDLAG